MPRPDPAADQPRVLGIFLQVCQTVAYAHARGVIHRDLKPSNVMVGSFGEVQVMDWGLAKVLPRGGVGDDAEAGKVDRQETVIATARSGSDAPGLSQAGSVMGTPAYMAPEQARGEIERVDERADVFALGSILCEILTGQPAFPAAASGEIQRKAARGDLADAFARLDACGADAELLALARACLAAEARTGRATPAAWPRGSRPTSAGCRSGSAPPSWPAPPRPPAPRRPPTPPPRPTSAPGRAPRPAVPGGPGGLVAGDDRPGRPDLHLHAPAAQRARAAGAVLAGPRRCSTRPGREARRCRRVARGPGGGGAGRGPGAGGRGPARRDPRPACTTPSATRLRQALVEVRANQQDAGVEATDAAYAAAFRDAGLDLDALSPTEAARRLRRRPAAVVVELAAYLDHWSAVRRAGEAPVASWRKPLEVARPPTGSLPRPLPRSCWPTTASRRPRRSRPWRRPPGGRAAGPAAVLLGDALEDVGEAEAAVGLLRAAAGRHPGDVWVNFGLAETLDG